MTKNPQQTSIGLVYLAWLIVILPIVWALWQTLLKVIQLFK
jgi:hypothetical protein